MSEHAQSTSPSSLPPSSLSPTSTLRWGLRWKLALLLGAICATTAVAVGLVSYESMQQRLRTEIDRSLIEATNRFLDGPNGGRRIRIGSRLSIVIPERPLGIEQYVVQVASVEGDVIASTPGVSLPIVAPGDVSRISPRSDGAIVRTVTSQEGVRYRVRAELVELPGLRNVVVQLGRDYSETDNVLADLRTRILVIGAAIVVIAAALGAAISAGVTSRIRRLSRAAERIAETGQLSVDLDIDGNDETGRLARSFRDMVGALEQSRSEQQRLVQDAGHELRTPLTSVRTNIDVLRRHGDLSDDVKRQILADLDHDINELSDLVEEIVMVAARSDMSPEVFERTDLGELVRGVVERFRRRSDREFVLDLDHSEVMVRRTSIERAVSNLLDNAVKFDNSREAIEVAVASGTVTVSDRGPGIAESELESIFSRFHRSAQARALPGSGLGLAIVADAVRAHGGGYFARGRSGGGAEVGFWLPRASGEFSPSSHPHPTPVSP
jgi:two-component system, OmpR family, sensor histidine kinase MprB